MTCDALLGDAPPRSMAHLQHWWDFARGSLIWAIWIHRNVVVFASDEALETKFAIACKAWFQLMVYMRLG